MGCKVVQSVEEYKGWHGERIKQVTIISIMNLLQMMDSLLNKIKSHLDFNQGSDIFQICI